MAGEWSKLPIRPAPPPPGHSGDIISGDARLRTVDSAESDSGADRVAAGSGSSYSGIEATNRDRAQERPSAPIGPGYSPSAGGEAAAHPGPSPPPGTAYSGFGASGEARLHAGDVYFTTPPPASAYSGFGAYDHGRLHAGNVNTTNYYYGSAGPPDQNRPYAASPVFSYPLQPNLPPEPSRRSESYEFRHDGSSGRVHICDHSPQFKCQTDLDLIATSGCVRGLEQYIDSATKKKRTLGIWRSQPAMNFWEWRGRYGEESRERTGNILHFSAATGHLRMVEMLCGMTTSIFEYDSGFVKLSDEDGPRNCTTALHLAAHYGHEQVVEFLLKRAFGLVKNEIGESPLSYACRSPHILDRLLTAGYSINEADSKGYTPLHDAAATGATASVRFLLEHGALVNCRNLILSTPLHLAVGKGSDEIARLLVDRGADIEAKNNFGNTPLLYAIYAVAPTCVRFLLEHGALVNCRVEKFLTPLHFAADRGPREVARLLLDHGAELEAKSSTGETPLHMAALAGNVETLQLLLGYGADTAPKQEHGWTPLHWSAAKGHIEAARLLLTHGADARIKDANGRTPLELAINLASKVSDKNYAPVVKLLQDWEEDQKQIKAGAANSRVAS